MKATGLNTWWGLLRMCIARLVTALPPGFGNRCRTGTSSLPHDWGAHRGCIVHFKGWAKLASHWVVPAYFGHHRLDAESVTKCVEPFSHVSTPRNGSKVR